VKLSYLIVGHTHEDIDQWFSVLSRFLKKVLMQVLSIGAFIKALSSCYKKEKCQPKCVEQIHFVHDVRELLQILDQHLARFDLDEQSNDKVHHFVFERNSDGKCVMHYKLKRYSEALYPREYNVGDNYELEGRDLGQVIKTRPFKDAVSKIKYWEYTVRSQDPNGAITNQTFVHPAKDAQIVMFPGIVELPSPDAFPIADFATDFQNTLDNQKEGVKTVFDKMQLYETYCEEWEWWQNFWSQIPADTIQASTMHPRPFWIPPQTRDMSRAQQPLHRMVLAVDDGVRDIDVVTHSQFKPSARQKALRICETQVISGTRFDKLFKGNFVVANLVPENSNWYPWQFVIAEIITDVSTLDTEQPETQFQVQVYRPTGRKIDLTKKFIHWIGDDNQSWRPIIERGMIRGIVDMHHKSKTLYKKLSKIDSIFYLSLNNGANFEKFIISVFVCVFNCPMTFREA
jgi:hypothetical protein